LSRASYAEPLVMLGTLMRWFVLASITGAIVGVGTSVFLRSLFFSVGKTQNAPLWVHMIMLPIGGLVNGLLLYYGYHHGKDSGKDSVIAAIHEHKGKLPFKTSPIKPIAALFTLALGGSAGREGPCTHIGGTLASWLSQMLHLNEELRKRVVICGISAGFASVFGTPLAGSIYGIEVLAIGQLRHDVLFPSFISGITSYEVSRAFGVPYKYYFFQGSISFTEILFFKVILIGILCGIASWLFIECLEQAQSFFHFIQSRYHIWAPAIPVLGALVLVAFITFLPTDYLGLSLPLMNRALAGEHIAFLAFFWKLLFVGITLGSGFYGGIATPQFVIGATAGNAFAHVLHISPILGAAVGMVAVVSASSNTPIAAIFMGFELFGSTIGIYALTASITSYLIVGHRSVYPDQLVAYPKSLWMHLEPGIPLNKEQIHVSYGFLRYMRKHMPHQYLALHELHEFRSHHKHHEHPGHDDEHHKR
jgi:H+/Cl- antiporter ClcA